MPLVRNGQYINIDESSSNSLHIPNNQVIETKMPMHNHLPPHQSPEQTAQLPSAAKTANQFGSPSIQHQPSGSQPSIQQTPLTKAELRKSNKPIMEKKRRARINHCLNELKTLILEAMKKDPARHTKLEKADILEMTVKYLQTIQRNQINAASVQSDAAVLYKFKAGFSDCTNEVSRYISQIDGVDANVKQRLMGHLNNCVTGIQQVATPPYNSLGNTSNTNYSYRSNSFGTSPEIFGNTPGNGASNALYQQLPLNLPVPQEINNNNRIQMGGVQFIPSRLPSGEFALVMPNSGTSSDPWKPFYPVDSLSLRSSALDLNDNLPRSAFSNVTKTSKPLDTSPLSPASSVSSMDDSSMNQSELQTSVETSSPQRTPQKSLTSIFPTPPSGGSISLILTSHSNQQPNSTITSAPTLQQPHVTSTTEQSSASISAKIRPLSLDMSMKEPESDSTDYQCAKRRLNSSQSPENNKDGEPLLKVAKYESHDDSVKSEESNHDDQLEASNGDMWRPW